MPERKARIVEACVALLSAVPGKRLNITSLNKALFYLDLLALRDRGRAVTGSPYIALPQGPVVASYEKRIVKALDDAGLARQQSSGMAKPMELVGKLDEFKHLEEADVELAKKIGKEFSMLWSSKLSDYSHENVAWRMAFDRGAGTPVNMTLALTQILDDDPWIEAPLTEEQSEAADKASDCDEAWA